MRRTDSVLLQVDRGSSRAPGPTRRDSEPIRGDSPARYRRRRPPAARAGGAGGPRRIRGRVLVVLAAHVHGGMIGLLRAPRREAAPWVTCADNVHGGMNCGPLGARREATEPGRQSSPAASSRAMPPRTWNNPRWSRPRTMPPRTYGNAVVLASCARLRTMPPRTWANRTMVNRTIGETGRHRPRATNRLAAIPNGGLRWRPEVHRWESTATRASPGTGTPASR